jgi:DNA-binding PucR family transcriptional regulator
MHFREKRYKAAEDLRPNTADDLLEHIDRLAIVDAPTLQLSQLILLPLVREDAERGHNLVDTLRTYYATGARVDLTADRLFLHRNSVRYRLDRIRALLRMNVDEPKNIAALTIALRLIGNAAHHQESETTNADQRP